MSSISTDGFPVLPFDGPARRRESPARSVRSVEPPRPRTTISGKFPVVAWQPEPPRGLSLRLRRAVAVLVVLGTVSLVGYAAWQRAARAHEPASPLVQPATP